MQNKQLTWIVLRQVLINLVFCPKLLQFGFALDSVCPHIKFGLGQIDGIFVRFCFCHSLTLR